MAASYDASGGDLYEPRFGRSEAAMTPDRDDE